MALQIRRGLQTDLPANPADGELMFATDTGNLYIGDSGTPQIITTAGGSGANRMDQLTDVASISGIANGQVLIWNASSSRFEAGAQTAGGSATLLGLTDVGSDGTSGQALTTDGAGGFTFTTVSAVGSIADLSDVHSIAGIADGQVLQWNAGNSRFEIATPVTYTAYTDADVTTKLATLSGHILPDTDVTYDLGGVGKRFRDLYLSGNTITLGTTTIRETASGEITLGTAVLPSAANGNVATETYVTTAIAALVDTAPGTLDTLNELAAALGDDANYATTTTNSIALKADTSSLSTVATSGLFADLSTRPTITLAGNNLTYDGTTVDLTSVVGATGDAGATGPAGPAGSAGADGSNGATGAAGSDGAAGNDGADGATGPAGSNGSNGTDGTSISSGAVSSGTLTLTMSDASTITVGGSVAGATGAAGADGSNGSDGTNGIGITSTALVGSNLTLTYSNTSVQDVGSIQGPQGVQGADGAVGTSISSAAISGSALTLTMSDSSTIAVSGSVVGPQGATGPAGSAGSNGSDGAAGAEGAAGAAGATGSTGPAGPAGSAGADGSNGADSTVAGPAGPAGSAGSAGADGAGLGDVSVTTASAGSAALTYNSGTGVLTFTPPDLSSYLTSETDSQTLSLSGTDLTISGGNTLDVSSLGGSSYTNASVDTHLNQSTASTNEVLSWNGSDYDWVAQSGGTTTLLGLTDVGSDGTNGQALVTDGSGNFTFASVGSGGTQNLFQNIAVAGQSTLVADGTTDTLTLAAGSGISLTTTAGTDTVTIAATGGGGGGSGASVERFKLLYNAAGNLDSTSDLTSGITTASIAGDIVTITLASGNYYPPASVMIYGYDYTNNKYYMSTIETTMSTRELAGGGSSGSPTLFNGSSTISFELRLRETETGASRGSGFGVTTHAWIQMVLA